jgi:hypothetical protein
MSVLIASLFLLAGFQESPSALERDPGGWIDLLADAGPELKGWTRGTIPPGGKLDAVSQWSIDPATGHLVCAGTGGHEWLRYDKAMGDFLYHVEWRFAASAKPGHNSGIYVRNSADATVWHQAQTGSASGRYLFGETMSGGKLTFFSLDKQVADQRVKPASEWNVFEFTCKGKDVTLWVNGAVVNEWDDCQVAAGHVGVEAEGFRIEFRNVKVKPL